MASSTHIDQTKWLPSICWVQENAIFHTRINVFPSSFCRDPSARFVSIIQLFEANKLLTEYRSEPAGIESPLRIQIRDVLNQCGVRQMDGIAEIIIQQVGVEPKVPTFLEAWCDIYSDDNVLDVSVPAVPIAGSIKVPISGKYRYQLFPGVLHSSKVHTEVLLLNPYSRVLEVFFFLANAQGQKKNSSTIRLAARGYLRASLSELFPDAENFLGPTGLGSVVVGSTFKLIEFVLMKNTADGRTTCMDHMVPFIDSTHEITEHPSKIDDLDGKI